MTLIQMNDFPKKITQTISIRDVTSVLTVLHNDWVALHLYSTQNYRARMFNPWCAFVQISSSNADVRKSVFLKAFPKHNLFLINQMNIYYSIHSSDCFVCNSFSIAWNHCKLPLSTIKTNSTPVDVIFMASYISVTGRTH